MIITQKNLDLFPYDPTCKKSKHLGTMSELSEEASTSFSSNSFLASLQILSRTKISLAILNLITLVQIQLCGGANYRSIQ